MKNINYRRNWLLVSAMVLCLVAGTAVSPGTFGIAVVSPPLDDAGNSVKSQLAIKHIVEKLAANPYLIQPNQI